MNLTATMNGSTSNCSKNTPPTPDASERWKLVPECPHWQVSNHGRVKHRGQLKTPHFSQNKTIVYLPKYQSWVGTSVARLVGELWCPEFRPEKRARFRDGNRHNTHPDNLEWISVAEVTVPPRGEAQGRSKLKEFEVLEIRASPLSPRELAARYRISRTTIHEIVRRETWKHL